MMVGALVPAAAAPTAIVTSLIITCTSDSCDGGLWQAARGAANEISYWGMGAGHNCTNYVAWKLISNGVTRPNIGLGDAGEWAGSAVSNGVKVDSVPAIGAVAQWDAYADNVGMYGHVAYVEKVNGNGTILVSEDYWRPNNAGGPLTFRTVDASTVSNFIHFGDRSRWIREVAFEAPPAATVSQPAETLLQPGDVAPSIPPQEVPRPSFALPGEPAGNPFIVPNPGAIESGAGTPAQPTPNGTPTPEPSSPIPTTTPTPPPGDLPPPTGTPTPSPTETPTPTATPTGLPVTGEPGAPLWQERSTGLLRQPTAMSAVTMRAVDAADSATGTAVAASTQLVFADGGMLITATRSPDGWTIADTGLTSRSESLVAVDMGGQWPQVVSVDEGQLFLSAASRSGWQKMATGIRITGEMAALDMGGLWPTIMVAQNDKLFQVHRGMQGWQVSNTGIAVSGALSAVNAGGIAQVFAIEGGVLQQLWADELGWHKKSTGIEAAGVMSAVVVNGAVQVILLEDGVVNQVTLDSTGWHRFSTRIPAGAEVTAVDVGTGYPLIIQAG